MGTDHIYAEGAGNGGGGTASSRAGSSGSRSMADRARQAVNNMVTAFRNRGNRNRRPRRNR